MHKIEQEYKGTVYIYGEDVLKYFLPLFTIGLL